LFPAFPLFCDWHILPSISPDLFAPARRAYINRIGCAVPPNDIHEGFIHFGATLFEDTRHRSLFKRMAQRSGIAHRYSTLALGNLDEDEIDREGFYRRRNFPTTEVRMQRYDKHALPLVLSAVADLGVVDYSAITHLIVASCTGFTAPGVDLQVLHALGLPTTVFRTLVSFMGCAAAVPALRLANDIVLAHPDAQVLVVNVELCTLHFQDSRNLETVLSFLLFGDGCSVALVTSRPDGVALEAFRSAVLPDSETLITWKVGNSGFDMRLAGEVPATIAKALGAATECNDPTSLLQGYAPQSFDHWMVHAGGRTVLDAVERGLDLLPSALAVSRSILNDFGNMSSATIMFALRRMMECAVPGQRGVALAFGPGLVAESFQFIVSDA